MKFWNTCIAMLMAWMAVAQTATLPADRIEKVKKYLERQPDYSGIVMVAAGGEARLMAPRGYADRANRVPYSSRTLATMGSITKSFTATAILKLAQTGKLSTDDRITRYFTDVPADKQAITLHHLLTHTAGFPGAIGDDYEAADTDAFLKLAMSTPLSFRPGEGYDYTNVGYSLLGIIIERMSGMSYSDFLRREVLTPAGMSATGYTAPAAHDSLLTHGYRQDGTDWGTSKDKLWNGSEPFWHLKANGGLLTSADDMFRWYLALRNRTVLPDEWLQKQITPYADEGGGSFYGYGVVTDERRQCVQHNGGNGIFKADFRWYPALDVCIFATTNDASVRLFRMDDAIERILLTGELPDEVAAETWQSVDMTTFPADARQRNVAAFLACLQKPSPECSEAVLDTAFSEGIMQRNGRERMTGMFEMLAKDSGSHAPTSILQSGNRLQLVIPAAMTRTTMKITLTFDGDRVDKMMAELEN